MIADLPLSSGQRRAAMLLGSLGERDREAVLLAASPTMRARLRREAAQLLRTAGGDRALLALALQSAAHAPVEAEAPATSAMPPRLAAAVRAAWSTHGTRPFAELLHDDAETRRDG